MSRTQKIDPRLNRRAAALASLLAGCVPAFAQDSATGFGLRTTIAAAPMPSTVSTGTGPGSASIGAPAPTDPSLASPPSPNARLRRPSAKRLRSPTLGAVRAQVRAPVIAPGLVPDLQPGLVPDVAAPVRPGGPAPVRRRNPDEDPYAQLGVRIGSLTVYPSVGESLGYDTNPNRVQSSRGSFVSQTEGEFRLQSDWSRHELTGYLRGAYDEYTSVPAASRPEGAGKVNLRLDATRDTQINLEARYLIDTQRPDSPELNSSVRTRPVVYNEGASIGLTQRFNRLIGTIQGTVDRADYENAYTTAGTLLSQADRDLTQFGLRARLGYEFTPGLIPFVEGLADTRDYDRRVDFSGYARSSDGLGARIGTTFEATRLITGEIAAGVINRSYDDARLRDLTSPLLDASVNWALTPLTTIKATAQAGVDETTVVGANGIRTLRGTVEVIHALRRNLTVTAGLTASEYDYQGVRLTEEGFGASLKAEYKFTRDLALRASYLYERLHSTDPTSSYSANVFLLGMRYQP